MEQEPKVKLFTFSTSEEVKNYLIFLFPYSPTAWDGKRFGFDFLLAQGINIKVFDLSPLISTRSDANNEFLQATYITKINSYAQLDTEICATVNNSIYIDNINGLNGFKWQSRQLFRLFKKYYARYYLVQIGSLPLLNKNKLNIISKIKKAFNIKKLTAFVKWKLSNKLVHLQANYFGLYQLPEKIFVGHTEMVDSYLKKYRLPASTVIPIHSFDYDRYLDYIRNKQNNFHHASEKNTCVFLDQALAYHSDFGKSVSFNPVTAKKYFASMQQFFDKIEKETALKVIIAASPRAGQMQTASLFGNRTVIRDQTLELVAHSSLILMHSSTAVSFAILFNKPIVVLKTTEMANSYGFGNFLDNMALSLGVKPICIDNQEEMSKWSLKDYLKGQNNFDSYKYKYIMTKGLVDKTIWEIVKDNFIDDIVS